MDLGLSEKKALVTASSQGIGRACALELARNGADVVICARNEDALFDTRAAVAEETGRQMAAVAADLTKKGDIDNITLKVEILPEYRQNEADIRAVLVDQLRVKTNLGYNIEFHPYESLPRSQTKSRRFQDQRPKQH